MPTDSPAPSPAPAPAQPPSETGTLLRLAAPVIVSQFSVNALSLISTAVIGRIGPAELAAVAYGNAAYYLGFIVLLGIMLSVAPRVAAAHGAGDPAGVARAARAGLLLAALLSAAFLPLAFLAAHLLQTHAPEGLRGDLAGLYLRLYALGMPATLAFSALRGALEGTGQPRPVTAIALGGALLAAVLSPALTFGWGPLPALGLPGAALTSVLVYWLSAALLAAVVRTRLPTTPTEPGAVRAELRVLARLGWPIGLTLGAEGGLFTVTSLLMARFGPDALAAHNVALQVITAVFMVPLGLATATGIRVAHHHGAGNPLAARRVGLLGGGIAVLIMLLVSLSYVFTPRAVIGVFVNVQDPANARLIAQAAAFLLIATLFQAFDGLQVSMAASLRGLQDTRVPMLISLGAYWIVGLGSGVLLAFGLGLGPRGLWFGLCVGLMCTAALLLARFLHHTRTPLDALSAPR
ncbi:MATE family efflux transporter (plasmid) [Deinococcus aquaticus]|uniref:Multidrug-efflux transporter n=3 Tax=Deinococcus aquaticus TaxID=328692 RepID=A0ABY7V6F6_9DEIO|nr:MATE family efflux transporter [Deinococcus aquaticus]WDA60396.1 MATE family efflux transporter [Deinococcus aquaticus]